MFPFIETIRIENGKPFNLEYHNNRMNVTRKVHFGLNDLLDLADYIVSEPYSLRTRCRVEYAETILNITYVPYHIRPVSSLKLQTCDAITYTYKSSDRNVLNDLFLARGNCHDVLIVKEGLLTDTSIANIALFDGNNWFTPLHPLLKGTKRAELIDKQLIKERDIQLEELPFFSHIALFNAMIEWQEIVFEINGSVF